MKGVEKKIFGYNLCGASCDNCDFCFIREKPKGLVLTKKKVSSHYVPPDMQAIKILLDRGDSDFDEDMSDEELEKLRAELINNFLGEKNAKSKTKRRTKDAGK